MVNFYPLIFLFFSFIDSTHISSSFLLSSSLVSHPFLPLSATYLFSDLWLFVPFLLFHFIYLSLLLLYPIYMYLSLSLSEKYVSISQSTAKTSPTVCVHCSLLRHPDVTLLCTAELPQEFNWLNPEVTSLCLSLVFLWPEWQL